MPRNYKSWLAFMTLLIAYGFAVFSNKPEPIVYTTGLFLIVISIALMLRSEQLLELLKIILGRFKKDA